MSLPFPSTGYRLWTTYKFVRDPYTCYQRWHQDYGDTFIVNAMNGDVVVTCDPENVQKALSAGSDDVRQFAVGTSAPLIGETAVIVISGPPHKQKRRLLSHSFGRGCVAQQLAQMEQSAVDATKRWTPGEQIRVMDYSLDVSLDVIIRVVFGVTDTETMVRFRDRIKSYVASFHPLLAFTRIFQRSWFGLSPWDRFQREKRGLETMLESAIDEAVACEDKASRGLLGQIIESYQEEDQAIDKPDICSQLITMLLAGHETTQIAIAWAMSWLHRHPEFLDRLRSEIQTKSLVEMIKDSELLDGVCQESLRLNAILPDFVRTLNKPMIWSGVELPAGTNIGIATYLLHSRPEIYPEPDAFRPDRWSQFRVKPHQFTPFGGGVRRCLGANMATMEMKTVLVTWLREFEFALPGDSPEVESVYRRNLTMAPKSGIPLIVKEKV
ncbi:MAG: cytochrome P450 [Planctomycetota bacterium]